MSGCGLRKWLRHKSNGGCGRPQATSTHEQDLNFVQRVLSINDDAAAELRARYHGRIVAVLCARGANPTEAEDLVADLWSDCFAAEEACRSSG